MNDKCVVLNAKKMNFDGKLDFSVLSSDVTVYDDTTEQQLSERIQGNHDNFTRNLQIPHVEVNGKTLGVIGAGHIGRKVIQIAQALDMNILVYTRTPREDEKGIHYVSLEELLKNSDYVSMHCPLTKSTKHMINKETLSLMKPSAFIVNSSRGALIDKTAAGFDSG